MSFKDFAFRYIFLLKFLQIYGRLYHLVPASHFSQKTSLTIGSLCSPDITPVLSYYGPIRHPLAIILTSQRLLVIELTCSKPFFLGQGGFLQLLDMSLLPCRRYHPAGIVQTCTGQFSFAYTAFASKLQALASRVLWVTRPPVRLLSPAAWQLAHHP